MRAVHQCCAKTSRICLLSSRLHGKRAALRFRRCRKQSVAKRSGHALRALEARIGVRLLSRTTRSVAPTPAGERLLHAFAPRFEEIESRLAAIVGNSGQAGRHDPHHGDRLRRGYLAVAAPRRRSCPTILTSRSSWSWITGLSDIVADRYDIGVRWGDPGSQGRRSRCASDRMLGWLLSAPRRIWRNILRPDSPKVCSITNLK